VVWIHPGLSAVLTAFFSRAALLIREQDSYLPLSGAMNYALERLSEIEVDGLPEFKNHIAFVPCKERAIQTNRITPGSLFKPDIAIMSIEDAYEFYEPGRPYAPKRKLCELMNEISQKAPSGSASWSTVLSVIEIKRGKARWASLGVADDKGKQLDPMGDVSDPFDEEQDGSQPVTRKFYLFRQDFTLTPVIQRCRRQPWFRPSGPRVLLGWK
jgi:hypothetical protein